MNDEIALELALLNEAVYSFERYTVHCIPADWYQSASHRDIAQASADAWEHGGGGLDAVAQELQRVGKLVELGGKIGLHRLLASSPAVPDADLFKEWRRARVLREIALKAAVACEKRDVHEALHLLGSVSDAFSDTGVTLTAAECAERTLTALQSPKVPRISPGLAGLQNAIGTLPVGSVTVIGGATNVGKSSVALEMLIQAADRGECVGYISREDPEAIVGSRIIGALSGVSSARIQNGDVSVFRSMMPELSRAVGKMRNWGDRFLADCQVGGNELDVCAAMTRMATRGARLICVDYLQVLEASQRKQDRTREVGWLVTRLKAHAVRLGVALVLVSQLKRPPSQGYEPTKHDLKESGDIENSAEVILLLWRTEESDDAQVFAKLAKVKWGGVGQSLVFKRNSQTWRLEEQ